MSYEQTLLENAQLGATVIGEYLKGKRSGGEMVRVGGNAITQHNRFKATQGVFTGIKYAALRDVAKDRGELKKLVAKHTPEIFDVEVLE